MDCAAANDGSMTILGNTYGIGDESCNAEKRDAELTRCGMTVIATSTIADPMPSKSAEEHASAVDPEERL